MAADRGYKYCTCHPETCTHFGRIIGKEKKINIMENTIITNFEYPPIPIRQYDWSAVRNSYDEGDLIGYGKTEQEAINDLIKKENEKLYN